MPHALGNYLVRKRHSLTGVGVELEGIEDGIAFAEVSPPVQVRGHADGAGHFLGRPDRLIGDKEKGLVFHDRSAYGGPDVLLREGLLLRGEEGARVKGVVPEKPPGGTMVVVHAGAGGDVDDSSRSPSECGRVVAGLELELLDGVDGHAETDAGIHRVLHVDSVEQEDRAFSGSSMHREVAPENTAVEADSPSGELVRGDGAGLQLHQLNEIPSVQGQVDDGVMIDHVSDLTRLGLQCGRGPQDLDDFLDLTR